MLMSAVAVAQAAPRGAICVMSPAAAQSQCAGSSALLPVRDTQSAGRGGGNSCWSACFNNYNECVDLRPKPQCVATMKLCLETCDRLANRSGN
ncbi:MULTISPECIES: hypothetical protein [Rhodomicrobium]|uniref:hypothetical protein n=1 Tax=Rhodomicrobium TaxID=1068 RepID=UPI000F739FF0|nr:MULTISPECIES: hypothetical protein [Rhodomicrobium]